jgi:hypothetical protein
MLPSPLLGQAPGLVAAYSFNEGTGNLVADASGNGNTGTIANAVWTTAGKYGNALHFNGTNAWVSVNDASNLDLQIGMTLEAWVNPSSIPPNGCSPSGTCSWMDVIHKDSDRYYIEASSNQAQVPEAGGIFQSGKHVVFGPSVLPLNTWTHLALTYDSTMIRFYINGLLVASSPETSPITTSTNPLFIGGDQTMGQFFDGLIDEVRIYNLALTQAQIQADMNTPIGTIDTQPPTVPTNLTANGVSGVQINLSWTASTDDVAVTGYFVERCPGSGCSDSSFVQIAAPTGTTYSDMGLAANTTYSYRVRATDAAGFLSPYSNVATATTMAGTSGLVAAYSFGEGAGSIVTDASGNGNAGTIVNAVWTTGKYGSALYFNGTNAGVMINDAVSLHLTTAMTLEAWVNPSAVNSGWMDVIYKGNDNYFLEATSPSGGVPGGGGTLGGAGVVTFGAFALPANTWSHLATTYDGATLRLYVNGVQVSSLAQTGNILTSANPLQIGGDSIFGQYFQGAIDEVRIYNLALTQAQIQADMNKAL